MKRVIIILVAIAIGGYFAYDYYQDKIEKMEIKEARQKERELQHIAVAQMISKYNAVNDWEEKLSEGRFNIRKKILTMELEKSWLIDRPILFKGRIRDIYILDASNYRTIIDGLNIFRGGSAISDQLALSLNCQKGMIDSFLRTNKDASSVMVAVIANINKVEPGFRKIEEGGEKEIKIGIGDCIDILLYDT